MSYSKTREQFVIIDVLILLKQQILKVYSIWLTKKLSFFQDNKMRTVPNGN